MINRNYDFTIEGINFRGKKLTVKGTANVAKSIKNVLLRKGLTIDDFIFKNIDSVTRGGIADTINASHGVETNLAAKRGVSTIMNIIENLIALEDGGYLGELFNALFTDIEVENDNNTWVPFVYDDECPALIVFGVVKTMVINNNFLSV